MFLEISGECYLDNHAKRFLDTASYMGSELHTYLFSQFRNFQFYNWADASVNKLVEQSIIAMLDRRDTPLGLSESGGHWGDGECPPPSILEDQLTLYKTGGQIMPTTLLLASPDFHTLLRPWPLLCKVLSITYAVQTFKSPFNAMVRSVHNVYYTSQRNTKSFLMQGLFHWHSLNAPTNLIKLDFVE